MPDHCMSSPATAQVHTPGQPASSVGRHSLVWIPAGVAHRVDGQALVLRLRKNAFSPDQATDVQARALLSSIDAWARQVEYWLPLPGEPPTV